MTNKETMLETYTLLASMLLDATSDANEANNYDNLDEMLGTVDKISTILKRVADTTIIDELVKNNEKEEVEI